MSNGHYWTDTENRAKTAREHTEDINCQPLNPNRL